MERLPKGHRVLVQVPDDEGWRMRYAEEKITPEKVGDRLQIEAFVSGDTEELGLSVVALDNPEYCVCRADFHGESDNCPDCWDIRNKATAGLIDRACNPAFIGGITECPY